MDNKEIITNQLTRHSPPAMPKTATNTIISYQNCVLISKIIDCISKNVEKVPRNIFEMCMFSRPSLLVRRLERVDDFFQAFCSTSIFAVG